MKFIALQKTAAIFDTAAKYRSKDPHIRCSRVLRSTSVNIQPNQIHTYVYNLPSFLNFFHSRTMQTAFSVAPCMTYCKYSKYTDSVWFLQPKLRQISLHLFSLPLLLERHSEWLLSSASSSHTSGCSSYSWLSSCNWVISL